MTQSTELLPATCPFCGSTLNTNRLGNNPRHPDNDCFLSGQVIHVSQIPAWNTRSSPDRNAVLETTYRVLRDWRLNTIGQEDEPSEGYPLVDAVSTPGGCIDTGEDELREIAFAVACALTTTPEPTDPAGVSGVADIGDGHEEYIKANLDNPFSDFADPGRAGFDAGWDAAKAALARVRQAKGGNDATG